MAGKWAVRKKLVAPEAVARFAETMRFYKPKQIEPSALKAAVIKKCIWKEILLIKKFYRNNGSMQKLFGEILVA